MANDSATMTVDAEILPDEIAKTLSDESCVYRPADTTEGWYYKMVDIITGSSQNLISTETFIQKGTTAAGVDSGATMPAITTSDKVKFLFIKNTGYRDNGATTNTADSIYITIDGGAVAYNTDDAIEITSGEVWFGKFNNVTVADINCISGQKAGAGTGGNKIQALVAAVIDDVA